MELSVNYSDKKDIKNLDLFSITSQSLLEDDFNSQSDEELSPSKFDLKSINSYSQEPQLMSSELEKRVLDNSPSSQIQEKKNLLFKKYCSSSLGKISKKNLFFQNKLIRVSNPNSVKTQEQAYQNIASIRSACKIKLSKLNKRLDQYQQKKNEISKPDQLKSKNAQEGMRSNLKQNNSNPSQLNQKKWKIQQRICKLSKKLQHYDNLMKQMSFKSKDQYKSEL